MADHQASTSDKLSELDDASSANKQLKQALAAAQATIADLNQKMQEANRVNDSQQQTFNNQKTEVEKAKEQVLSSQQMMTELRNENIQLSKQMNFIKNSSTSTIERLTTNSEQALAKIKQLESSLINEQTDAKKAISENKRLAEQLDFIKQNSATTFERLTKSAEHAANKARQLEAELKTATALAEQLKVENAKLTNQKQFV